MNWKRLRPSPVGGLLALFAVVAPLTPMANCRPVWAAPRSSPLQVEQSRTGSLESHGPTRLQSGAQNHQVRLQVGDRRDVPRVAQGNVQPGAKTSAQLNAQLLRIERQRQHLQAQVIENLENQFTVGYKANVPLPEDDKESAIDMTEGPVVATRVATHVAILGRGFFQFEDGSYSRDGRFAFADGLLQSTGSSKRPVLGFPLDSQGNISGNPGAFRLSFDEKTKLYDHLFAKIGIDNTGRIYGIEVARDTVTEMTVEKSTPLFQLGLVDFENPQYMRRVDATRLRSTPRAGKNFVGFPGQGNLGEVAGGFLELSNVNFKEQSYWLGWLEKGRFEPPFPSADERMHRAAPFQPQKK